MFLILSFIFSAHAQITDASFFPSMRSINPGVAHLRTTGFAAIDVSKKAIVKKQDVTTGGIVGGINTNVDLQKNTLLWAGKGPGINFEALFDQETGERVEKINSTSRGKRTVKDEASSSYYGGILDLKYIGLSYSGAQYDYLYKFRIGTPPDVSAHDIKYGLDYTNIKVGSVIKLGPVRLGGFMLQQKYSGDYAYTYYNPSDGVKGTTETFPVTGSAKGFGAGVGFTSAKFRAEASIERMYANKFSISKDFPKETTTPPPATRMSYVGEVRFPWFAVGMRFRQNKGNFTDLEDLIPSNLLYGNLGRDDSRTETSFNFSFGSSKGFSPSAFYSQSSVTAQEKDPIFDPEEKYKAVTTSKAYGVSLSYVY